jgi:hypothetical protein
MASPDIETTYTRMIRADTALSNARVGNKRFRTPETEDKIVELSRAYIEALAAWREACRTALLGQAA